MEGKGARRSLTVGFVGSGAVASSLAPALAAAGYPVVVVWSRREERAAALAARIPGCQTAVSPQDVVDQAQLVVLAVPDDAIESVCMVLRWSPQHAVIHCSGALGRVPLAPAATAGAQTGVFHPLQTFAGRTASLTGISIALEAPEPLVTTLEEMARAIGGQPLRLQADDWPRYHVAAVFASNYVVSLLAIAVRLFGTIGLSSTEALVRLLPLVHGTVENLALFGLPSALTGPIARGDIQTLAKHLAALADEPQIRRVYLALAKATVPLAEARAMDQPELLAQVVAVRDFLEQAAREERHHAGDSR